MSKFMRVRVAALVGWVCLIGMFTSAAWMVYFVLFWVCLLYVAWVLADWISKL